MNQASACIAIYDDPAASAGSVLHAGLSPADYSYHVPSTWRGKFGAALPGETLRLRCVGNPSGAKVLVLGGISAGRFVADEGLEQKGWWRGIVSQGGAIDLDQYYVIGADYPPENQNHETALCPEDIARLLLAALQANGINHIDAFIGSSFGGMIGLAFARLFPERLGRLVIVCAAHQPNPMAQAWRLVQRRTIEVARRAGCPAEGVNLARQLAMTTYRAPEEFSKRFTTDLQAKGNVGDYLTAHGAAHADQVTPERYLTLSSAIDRHHENPEDITTPAFFLGAISDRLVPVSDIAELHRRYAGPSEFVSISSVYGHDAFLKETKLIGHYLRNFLLEKRT